VKLDVEANVGWIVGVAQFDEDNGGETNTVVPFEAVESTGIGKSGGWDI
jgi:hypothetical protein